MSETTVDISEISNDQFFTGDFEMGRKYYEALRRKKLLLSRAYPNYPTERFSEVYLNVVGSVLPEVLGDKLANDQWYGDARGGAIVRRLALWLDGRTMAEIGSFERMPSSTFQEWQWRLPTILRANVNYYELVRAADKLADELESAIDFN